MKIKEKYSRYSRGQLKDKLMDACELGDLELTDFLLNKTQLKDRHDICSYFINAIAKASKKGHIDIMKLLSSSLSDENKEAIGPYNNTLLVSACRDGNLDVIHYLLTSEDTKNSVDINGGDGDAIDWACSMGHLEVVKYLTSSTEISNHVNIDESKNAFIVACTTGNFDIVRHFIFNLNMNKSAHVQLFLENNPVEEVINMFNIREINQSLSKELNDVNISNKRTKI